MPAHTAAAGSELDISKTTVTARKALAYAAGIMDTSTQVFDDDRPGGILLRRSSVFPWNGPW